MANTYPFRVISQEETLFEGRVESIIAPAWEGYVGVMANHAPYLSLLQEGELTVTENRDSVHVFKVNGGVLEVSGGEAVILTESISRI
ncbi:MAG: hypothetical protein GC154_14295 [bacterium]|nr:hypothetical protein [bacterium]